MSLSLLILLIEESWIGFGVVLVCQVGFVIPILNIMLAHVAVSVGFWPW